MTTDLPKNELNKQPNSRHCFVCGLNNPYGLKLNFYDDGINQVKSTYTIPGEYQGYPGVAHGGIIAAILDEAAGRTTMIQNPNRFMMTAKLELRYRLPVPVEKSINIIGRIEKSRGRILQAIGEIYLPDGSLAVEANITLVELPESYQINDIDLETLGWKVYPD